MNEENHKETDINGYLLQRKVGENIIYDLLLSHYFTNLPFSSDSPFWGQVLK